MTHPLDELCQVCEELGYNGEPGRNEELKAIQQRLLSRREELVRFLKVRERVAIETCSQAMAAVEKVRDVLESPENMEATGWEANGEVDYVCPECGGWATFHEVDGE